MKTTEEYARENCWEVEDQIAWDLFIEEKLLEEEGIAGATLLPEYPVAEPVPGKGWLPHPLQGVWFLCMEGVVLLARLDAQNQWYYWPQS